MVHIENQSLSDNAAFSRILTRSNQYCNSRHQSTHTPTTRLVHVDLPEPPALLPALVAAGAKHEIAQAMQAAYHARACEFRAQALVSISHACSKLAQVPSTCSRVPDETVITAFKQIYLKKLNDWISEGVALLREKGSSVLHCREDRKNAPPKTPKTFNHQYVPLLELFFEQNAFPSHAEKVLLANKSNMSYRQIHVWFQNRRNRTKKDTHKKVNSEGVTLKIPICRPEKFTVLRKTKPDALPRTQSTSTSSTRPYDVLDGAAPRHAFPTIYPPSCEYDPFPSAPTFIAPEWSRRPSLSSERSSQSVIDVDELTEQFSRLNVWDNSLSRSQRKARKVTGDSSAATSAITVKPSPAPHPACIRSVVVVCPPPQITLNSIRTTTSSLNAFRSPSPDAPMTTLIPKSAHRRNIAPFSKRIPSRQPFTLNREISEGSINSAELTSSSRSLFAGSDAAAHRFTCHPSSDPSSAATTPETSPSPLAHAT